MRRLALVLVLVCFFIPPFAAQADTVLTDADKALLQQQLDSLNAEISQWQSVIDTTRAKKASLQGDVTALNALIKKAQAEINARNLTIKGLSSEISTKQQNIDALNDQLSRGRASLAQTLRIQGRADHQSIFEVVLSANDPSSFFGDLDHLATIRTNLLNLFDQIATLKTQVEGEKAALTDKQNAQLDAQHEVVVTQKQIASTKAQKDQLLAQTKNDEANYESVLAARQRQANAIRTALFNLRDTQGIAFGDALNYDNVASQKTGVRPALILAILSQESDLGNNVGACLVTSLTTGDGVGKNSGTPFEKIMKAPRDTDPFQRITDAVGLLWGSTPVSCPLGQSYTTSRGYGGAMGPSQFIPSTWELYEGRLRSALSISGTPNPWDPGAAIMATALYLQDLGAAGGTYTSERNAACKYYSGRSCDNRKPTNYTYGNSVITKADNFQTNIDFLKGTPSS